MLSDESSTSAIELLLLHSRADRALRSLLTSQFEQYNITMMEWLLLGVLSKSSRDGMSMSAIASELAVTLPQVTALMTSVVKKKLVRLRTLKQDRRSRHAALSAKGEDILGQVEEAVTNVMRNWPEEISSEQLAAYLETVKAMAYKDTTEADLAETG